MCGVVERMLRFRSLSVFTDAGVDAVFQEWTLHFRSILTLYSRNVSVVFDGDEVHGCCIPGVWQHVTMLDLTFIPGVDAVFWACGSNRRQHMKVLELMLFCRNRNFIPGRDVAYQQFMCQHEDVDVNFVLQEWMLNSTKRTLYSSSLYVSA